MKKKPIICFLLVFGLAGPCLIAHAKSEYIYRQRVNWVKIIKASPKEVPLGTLKHPYRDVTSEQMEAMLLSIKISRRFLLKKEVSSVDVFNAWEARKFAPLLVEGLTKVDPDHVVNFSVVHKRPLFILQNDHLSMGNLWVSDDGIHIQFTKLFAKLTGDYEQAANMDKELRRAKTRRITLEAHEGQKLSYNSATEMILDPSYDFVTAMQGEMAAEQAAEEEALKGKKKAGKVEKEPVAVTSSAPAPQSKEPVVLPASSGDAAARLRDLNRLKTEGLITEQEYQSLRKKILSEI